MKKILAILFGSIILCSCLEDLEPVQHWTRVVGGDQESGAGLEGGLYELPNGHILVLGSTGSADFGIYEQDFQTINEGDVTVSPSITELDEFGHFIQRRVYPIESIYVDSYLGGLYGSDFTFPNPLGGELTWIVPYPLNGEIERFVAVGRMFDIDGGSEFFKMDLDADYDLREIEFFSFYKSSDSTYRAFGSVHSFPNGDIAFLFDGAVDQTQDVSSPSTLPFNLKKYGFSMSRFAPDGQKIWGPFTYDDSITVTIPEGYTLQTLVNSGRVPLFDGGYIYVSGERKMQYPASICNCMESNAMIWKIDAATGQLVDSNVLTEGRDSHHFPRFLFKTTDGFALIDQYEDLATQKTVSIGPQRPNNIGILFVDNNLQLIEHVPVTTELIFDVTAAVQTQDGGYAILTRAQHVESQFFPGQLIKADSEGNFLWSRRIEGQPKALIETQDGGLLVSSTKTFNGLTPKATIVKFTANGN